MCAPGTTARRSTKGGRPRPGYHRARTSCCRPYPPTTQADALPNRGSDGSQSGPASNLGIVRPLEICGAQVFPTGRAVDSLAVAYQAPEYVQERAVTVYADEPAAAAVYETLVLAAQSCPREQVAGSSSSYAQWALPGRAKRWLQVDPATGSRGTQVTRVGGEEGIGLMLGMDIYQVVQQDNAVLLVISATRRCRALRGRRRCATRSTRSLSRCVPQCAPSAPTAAGDPA